MQSHLNSPSRARFTPDTETIGAVEADGFEIQIFGDSHCVLRRHSDHSEKEFANVRDALEFAQHSPGGRDSRLTVFDDKGMRFMQIVL